MFSAEDMLRYHRPFPFLATHNMRDKSGEIVTREDDSVRLQLRVWPFSSLLNSDDGL